MAVMRTVRAQGAVLVTNHDRPEAVVLDYACGEALSAAKVADACAKLYLAEPAPGVRGAVKWPHDFETRRGRARAGTDAVVTSSALRQCYRDMLVIDPRKVRIVYLKASFPLLKERLRQRGPHFMAPELLQSQFDTLEEPPEGLTPPAAIVADAAQPPETIVEKVKRALADEGRLDTLT
jgi:gluconate kinase